MRACNFCGNPQINITYNQPCDWPACAECNVLVIKNEFNHLQTRMINCWLNMYPNDYRKIGSRFVKRINQIILGEFMEARGILPFD